jgi:flagellar biosynthesis GTPase FlhF
VRNDSATRDGLATTAVQELVAQAHPFAEMLAEVRPEPEIQAPPKVRALIEGMVEAGLGRDLAREIVEATVANAMPFTTPGRLRTVVRDQLALRIPVSPAAPAGPRTLVFVGPAGAGKSAALAAIEAAHKAAGTADELRLIEAPEAGEVAGLEGAEVHLVLRAGTAGPVAVEAIGQCSPLTPTQLLLTGAGETAHPGGVVDAAIRSGLPLGYVAESAGEIGPVDARALAGRIVP